MVAAIPFLPPRPTRQPHPESGTGSGGHHHIANAGNSLHSRCCTRQMSPDTPSSESRGVGAASGAACMMPVGKLMSILGQRTHCRMLRWPRTQAPPGASAQWGCCPKRLLMSSRRPPVARQVLREMETQGPWHEVGGSMKTGSEDSSFRFVRASMGITPFLHPSPPDFLLAASSEALPMIPFPSLPPFLLPSFSPSLPHPSPLITLPRP